MPTTTVSSLLPELLVKIFQHLTLDEKIRAAQVCNSWRSVVYAKELWKNHVFHFDLEKLTQSQISTISKRGVGRIYIDGRSYDWSAVSNSWVKILGDLRLKRLLDSIPDLESLELEYFPKCNADFVVTIAMWPVLNGLRELRLPHISLETSAIQWIAHKCPNVEELDLTGCFSRGVWNGLLQWPISLRLFRNLRHVNLNKCDVQLEEIAMLLTGTLLPSDDEDRNLEQVMPSSSYIPRLETLIIRESALNDEAIKFVADGLSQTLRSFEVGTNRLSANGFQQIRRLANLRRLRLSGQLNQGFENLFDENGVLIGGQVEQLTVDGTTMEGTNFDDTSVSFLVNSFHR